jgi:hypothetical protein
MSTEKHYDPEDVSRSWAEISSFPKWDRVASPDELMRLMRWMLPRVMAYYSEDIWCAGWLENLHEELPKNFPEIARVATLLGEICTYWDDSRDPNADWINWATEEWEPYKPL